MSAERRDVTGLAWAEEPGVAQSWLSRPAVCADETCDRRIGFKNPLNCTRLTPLRFPTLF